MCLMTNFRVSDLIVDELEVYIKLRVRARFRIDGHNLLQYSDVFSIFSTINKQNIDF